MGMMGFGSPNTGGPSNCDGDDWDSTDYHIFVPDDEPEHKPGFFARLFSSSSEEDKPCSCCGK